MASSTSKTSSSSTKTSKKKKSKKKSSSSGSSSSYKQYYCVRDPNGKYETEGGVRVSVERREDDADIYSSLPSGKAKKKKNFLKNKKISKANDKQS